MDSGPKCLALRKRLESMSIDVSASLVYTTQYNGVAERMNQATMDRTDTMLKETEANERFWAVAINQGCTCKLGQLELF